MPQRNGVSTRQRGLALKRLIDVLGALCGLIATSPVMLLVAVLVRVKLGSPVFFRHERPGYQGRPFQVIKFRTMRAGATSGADPGGDWARVTPFGAFLRRTGLDELPQLWNILTGDMSFVGPRPLFMEFLPKYSAVHARRHEMRPGVTGWAQVNGRHTIPYSRRFDLDVWYVDNWSLWLDFKIMLMTIAQVARRVGSEGVEDKVAMDDLGLFERDRGGSRR